MSWVHLWSSLSQGMWKTRSGVPVEVGLFTMEALMILSRYSSMVPGWGVVSIAAVSTDISMAELAGAVVGGWLAGVVTGGRGSVTSVGLGGGTASRPLLSAEMEKVAVAGPDRIGWLLCFGVFGVLGPISRADRV